MNLSGIIFHIEEDAYEALSNYLGAIKSYFNDSDGRDEIMNDIESRIAEMFSEKVGKSKQAVVMSDVSEMIAQMGKPEDFAGDSSRKEEQRKASSEQSAYKNRRVFRDVDNKILGGVCAGIANYFGFSPVWLRLIWAMSFFAFGTGAILYLILWLIIPKAKTAAEKLEMHGEQVNAENIGKKVEEEIKIFGKKVESWSDEVKRKAENIRAGRCQKWRCNGRGMKMANFLSCIFSAFFNVFAKLLGLLLILIGLLLLIAVAISLLGETGLLRINTASFSLHDVFGMFLASKEQETIATIALVLFIGIPLLMLVYGGMKLLLGIKAKSRFVAFTAGMLWLTGLILMMIAGTQVTGQFAEEATSKNYFSLTQPSCDTLFLKVASSKEGSIYRGYRREHFRFSIRKRHTIIAADSVKINFDCPKLDIVRSETDSFEVIVYNEAKGSDKKEALRSAKNISYTILQKDSVIEFSPYFSIPKNDKWRAQAVYIEVRVPKNKMVYVSRSMKNILSDVNNEADTRDDDMTGRRWIMGDEELRCVDCDRLENNGDE